MVISFSRRLSRAATGSLLPAPVLWTSSISLREPGQKISDVLFRMTAAAVITGRVNNEDGEPMIRVQVVALRRPTEEETEEDIPFASRKQTLIRRFEPDRRSRPIPYLRSQTWRILHTGDGLI